MITTEEVEKTLPEAEAPRKPRGLKEKAQAAFKHLKSRRLFVILIAGGILPLSILKTLTDDGEQVFFSQKDALQLEVFARTDLPSELYPLLEENLRALEGVRQVTATSPDESLRKISNDPHLSIDPDWITKKKEDLKGKDTILPWSYTLHLGHWNDAFLRDLQSRIEAIKVGPESIGPVAEMHYDKERWALTFALFNYLRWIRRALLTLWAGLTAVFLFIIFRLRKKIGTEKQFVEESGGIVLLGLLSALAAHLVYCLLLAVSFFPESSGWKNYLGQNIVFETGLALALSFCAFGILHLEHKR